jgi:tRNA A-37 threonylcarbamoyl transferase component Bud32
MAEMIGQTLGHYRVTAKIGEGGMGAVYRAHDEILHRDVALKVLSGRAVMEIPAKEQVLEEARASSALSHPNICTVHEVGGSAGEHYIVMELVEGQTLSALIGKTGLPIDAVLRCGVQIAAALSHAHSRKVIHRDLKSSNIVVTADGLVKVLDFGLARRGREEKPGDVTQSFAAAPQTTSKSAISGTLSYMAPEVLRGEEADARSDLWALGVVLYEMASAELPFRGQTSFEISAAILNDLPAPLPARIPAALVTIVQRCLAKQSAQRYESAGEIRAALEAVQAASLASPEPPGEPGGMRTTVIRGMRHVEVKKGDALLLVGTLKGAFLLRSTNRVRWEVGGPYFHGHVVNAMVYDSRAGRRRLWASTQSPMWGTFLRSTDDFGLTWTNPVEATLKFPRETGTSLKNIWQICLGRPDEPDVMYCGVEPAALFESRDAGETWTLNRALFDHPHRTRWMASNGGLILHTVLPDPARKERIYVAISAGGVYRTDDGGASWKAANRGVRVVFMPEKYPEFGQCVHKIAMHPDEPERLFLQNHWGLYRSDDAGDNWQDIADGVPSDFGFPILVHPHDPDCVYVLPVESDEFRCARDGRLRVYRTRNAGNSWEALTHGLPQKGSYATVLRDAMCADEFDPAGIFFGTRNGELYGSIDEGKSWKKILEGLPAITCVKAALFGEPRVERRRERPRATEKPERKAASRPGKVPSRRAKSGKKSRGGH